MARRKLPVSLIENKGDYSAKTEPNVVYGMRTIFKLSISSDCLVEYVKEYFSERFDLESFRQRVTEQLAAYEEVEKKVSFHIVHFPFINLFA